MIIERCTTLRGWTPGRAAQLNRPPLYGGAGRKPSVMTVQFYYAWSLPPRARKAVPLVVIIIMIVSGATLVGHSAYRGRHGGAGYCGEGAGAGRPPVQVAQRLIVGVGCGAPMAPYPTPRSHQETQGLSVN